MDWHKIEQALIEIAKGQDIAIENNAGEIEIECLSLTSDTTVWVSLTDLAKELAERLA